MELVGQRFAYRERPKTMGEPVTLVEVIKVGPRGKQARIRYLDGDYASLEEWVPKNRLVVSWDEAGAFCRDERLYLEAWDASGDVCETLAYKAVGMVLDAITVIFDAELLMLGWSGIRRNLLISMKFDDAVQDLRLDRDQLLSEPHAFIDRKGWFVATFSVAENLAKKFCHRYPKEILQYLRRDEDEWRKRMLADGKSTWAEERLDQSKPVYELVQEWCGEEAVVKFNEAEVLREEISALNKEIHRLHGFIEQIANWLRDNGHPVKASMVRRQMRRRD